MANAKRQQILLLVAGGMMLLALSRVTDHVLGGRIVFGLSGDFFTGFLAGASVVVNAAAIALAVRAWKPV